jgi:hypothetical protein
MFIRTNPNTIEREVKGIGKGIWVTKSPFVSLGIERN